MEVDSLKDEKLELLNTALSEVVSQNSEYFASYNLQIKNDFKLCFAKTKAKANGPDYSCNSLIRLCKGQKEVAKEVAEFLASKINDNQVKIDDLKSIEASKFGHINVYFNQKVDQTSKSVKKQKSKKVDRDEDKDKGTVALSKMQQDFLTYTA